MAFAAFVVAAAAVFSAGEQRKASKQARKAAKEERRMAEVENVRSRRQAIRERILQTEQLRNAGAIGGTLNSSGVQGGIASLGSQTAANIGFQTQLEDLNNRRLSFLDSAAAAQGRAATTQAVGSVASMFAPGGSLYSESKTQPQPDYSGLGYDPTRNS